YARSQVASLLGAAPEEIIFTSGATESNNAVLLGLREYAERSSRKHLLATAIEHKSVLGPLERLQASGFEVELLPVCGSGFVDPDVVRQRLRRDTLLVTMMHANNETGVLQPVAEVSQILSGSNVLFHVDAAQTFGKEIESLRRLRCDYLSLSG